MITLSSSILGVLLIASAHAQWFPWNGSNSLKWSNTFPSTTVATLSSPTTSRGLSITSSSLRQSSNNGNTHATTSTPTSTSTTASTGTPASSGIVVGNSTSTSPTTHASPSNSVSQATPTASTTHSTHRTSVGCKTVQNSSSFVTTQTTFNASSSLEVGPTGISNSGWTIFTTNVSVITTYCPSATVITHGTKLYTVTEATTLIITDCPCTISQTWSTSPSVFSF